MTTQSSRCAVILPEAKAKVEIRSFNVLPPKEGHITVKVEFAGICGTDPHLWKGDFPLPGPVILGHEGIGIVHALHDSVKTDHASQPLAVGDRVYWAAIRPCQSCYYCTILDDECGCPNNFFMQQFEEAVAAQGTWSTYTEFATVGPRNAFYKVDHSVPPETFIALGCALPTVLQAIAHLPGGVIKPDENILIQGAGAVGLAAIMMAKISGANKVIVIEANKLRMAKATEFGADLCLDITQTTEESRAKTISDALGFRGVTLAFECSGVLGAVAEGLHLLARNGRYMLIGTWAGKGEVGFDPFVAVNKALTIQGSTYCAPRDYHNAVRLIEKNHHRFPVASSVSHRFALVDTEKGLETVLSGEAVKAVIQLDL
ncbi:hypothetical protein B0A52_02363 [Exophiala mesophila]|uniref:Enoyl reductase (ER) domain-containing protein n=1 Tax=Exophiala mesophila TaxID=212818 RepID=A0A438NBS6_EXOME|nr:hypothetical protein B0A52_02363 [Exophiala mesophila]